MSQMNWDHSSNLNILSTEEIYNYCSMKLIESIPSEVVLKIINEYETKLLEVQESKNRQTYKIGFNDGVEECRAALENI